jgi:hypothetical protein
MVDAATAKYIVENQKCFEDLKQVASQLAGMLVLAAAGSKEALPDHPALLAARELFREATDAVPRGRPTERALPHHTHLLRAAAAIGTALDEANRGLNVDRILIPLRAGYSELERAADALPGFEKVSYERACCGVRA